MTWVVPVTMVMFHRKKKNQFPEANYVRFHRYLDKNSKGQRLTYIGSELSILLSNKHGWLVVYLPFWKNMNSSIWVYYSLQYYSQFSMYGKINKSCSQPPTRWCDGGSTTRSCWKMISRGTARARRIKRSVRRAVSFRRKSSRAVSAKTKQGKFHGFMGTSWWLNEDLLMISWDFMVTSFDFGKFTGTYEEFSWLRFKGTRKVLHIYCTKWGPLAISWFITPSNYSYIYHKP